MIDASRRTGLFIISYVPLSAMFLALKWPVGWSADALLPLGAWVVAVAFVVLTPAGVTIVTGSIAKWPVRALAFLAAAVVLYGLVDGWLHPLALDPPHDKTSALAATVALWFAVLGLAPVGLLLYNAGRAGATTWTVTDPRDQSGAVAGYLATYLLPLLSLSAGGWRVTTALVIYLLVMYIIYVQSDALLLVNPTLALFHYRIYDVLVEPDDAAQAPWRVRLLTKLRITTKTQVQIVSLGDTNNYLGRAA